MSNTNTARSAAHAATLLAALLTASCGGSSEESRPSASVAPGLRAHALAANPTAWVTVPAPADPLLQGLSIPADAPTRGMWSPVQSWPLNALHAAVLPNGKLLSYGSTLDGGGQNGRYLDLWDPTIGFAAGSHQTTYRADQQDSFCSTATYLTDGRLMITGGNGSVTSTLYSPSSNSVAQSSANLADERWYGTMITLPDGRPLMLGGMAPYSEGMQDNPDQAVTQGLASMTPEVFESGSWRSLFNAYSRDAFGPDYLRASYPRAWVMPGGQVFGVSAERLWSLDPAGNGTITIHGAFKTAPNSTTKPNVGATNSAVMFDIGKVLVVGGNGSFNGDGMPASKLATLIDMNSGTPTLTEQPAMANPRRYPNTLVLPDGKVLVTGGTMLGNSNGANAVYAAESWNPVSGTWSSGASAAIYRGYHSFTVLLPNGAVLSTGGGAPGPVTNLNAEVYYPPQLFRSVGSAAQLAPRPAMAAISGLSYSNDAGLQVDMASAATISKLVLIGVSNGTHSFNSGQRRIPLAFTQDTIRLSTTIPNANLAPPGYYQLVAIDSAGVPSRGTIIAIGQGVSAPPVTTTPYNPPDLSASIGATVIAAGGTASYAVTPTLGTTYSWDFGDGSAATPLSATASTTHVYVQAGLYNVTLTATAADGSTSRRNFVQAVSAPATARSPNTSSALALEPRSGASPRVWVANPDADTVAVIDTATNARVAEIVVGSSPRSVALAPDGRLWVVNKGSASISIINAGTLAVAQTIVLPRASQPHGLVFAPGGANAYVVLEATGQLLKLDASSGAQQAALGVGANPRHLAISADAATVLVARFITPPLPGESTATIDTSSAGAEVVAVNAGPMTLNGNIVLHHSDKTDTEIQGAGVPNYLGAPAIAPDGQSAWVPSKQDNVKRGTLRNAQNLNFQNTVRAISSRIDMATLTEDLPRRIDHDNASIGSAALFHPSGVYLFVALETSRQVAVVNAIGGGELFRIEAGRAPQGLAVSADGKTLYVQNFMDRSVGVVDLSPLVSFGELRTLAGPAVATVATEKLGSQVLAGKQLFYDARDPRLARDAYMSCASCHADGGHDGRVWDLSGFGEGLRNTIALKGRAAMGHGFLHWSANFDELQDFEGQIRNLAGGTGLMTDAQFATGTRNQPLGDKKAGVSADLDALAAYLSSLSTFDPSPLRNADRTLTAAGTAGKAVFASANCASCHAGTRMTISADASTLRNIGTIKASSGQRLGAAITALDVPTLRDVWATAPYLHDGSAPTLQAAVQAHAGSTVAAADMANLVAYLQQIGGDESGPVGYWRLDEASGTAAADASGMNRPITLAKATRVAGRVGGAAQFNGTNASGGTATAVLDTAQSFTVSTWAKLDALTGWRTMVNQDGANVSGFWLQYSEAMGKRFVLTMQGADSTAGTVYRAVSTTTPVVGQWYHVAGVRDKAAGTMKIYVNGKLEGSTAYTGGWSANGALNIGRGKYGAPNDWFAGALDEVQAHGTALADADVAQLYQQGLRSLSVGWRFDEGTGVLAADNAGINRPLTLSNGSWVAGKVGQALQFNGTSSVATTPAPVLDTAQSFSVAAWVRPSALTGWRTMVNQDGANVSGFWLQYSEAMGKKFVLTMHDADSTTSNAYRAVSTTTPAVGQWYHVLGVRDKVAGTMKIYVNGKLEGSTAYTGGWAANGALNVGRGKYGTPNDWFAGAVDEVQTWNTGLIDADVAAIYARGAAAVSPASP